jgi:hypothetical protein
MEKKNVVWLEMLAVALILGFAFTGCTTFKATGLQTGLSISGRQYERVGYFSEKVWTNKFLGWPIAGLNGGTLFDVSAGATDPKTYT